MTLSSSSPSRGSACTSPGASPGPIQQLAEGTREVAAGNLDYKVQARADDEIGMLVESFNRMTERPRPSKAQLEEAYRDLQAKHAELEERRRYTETVLEAVTTGVVSLDPLGRVTTINRAAEPHARHRASDGQRGPALPTRCSARPSTWRS